MEKGRIIVVEDEQNILSMLTELLTENGYSVDPFIDSRSALVALKNNGYDIMITDLLMPKVDGLQLINFIQKEYLNNLLECVTSGRKKFNSDFFVVVLTKNERLLPNVFRNYFFSCISKFAKSYTCI